MVTLRSFRRSEPRLTLIVVGFAAASAFLPGLFGDFLTWDDDRNFLHNPGYRGLGWANLHWMFTTAHMGPYAPLSWVTLGLDYLVWGLNPLGYHLTSLLIHALNAMAFTLLAWRLLALAVPTLPERAVRLGGAGAGLLFAVHPLRVESVVWITERRDVVSGFFFLLTVLVYLRAVEGAPGPLRRGWYWATMGLFTAALLSKAIVVTLPVLLLVLDVYPLRRLGGGTGWLTPAAGRVVLEKAPLFALSALCAGLAVAGVRAVGNSPSLDAFGLGPRVAVSVYGLAFYLWKTLVPLRLSPLYEVPPSLNPLSAPYLASAAVVVALSVLAWAFRRRWPPLAAAWVAYVVSLLPVLGLFQNGPQIAADRYTYLACLGWALLAGGGLARCATRWWQGPSRAVEGAVLTAAAVAVVVLVALASRQSLVWQTSETLWTHALAVDPGSARAHTALAALRLGEGDLSGAQAHLQQALERDAGLPEALMGLAIVQSLRGEREVAVATARAAVARRRDLGGLHYHLGEVLRRAGRREEALSSLRDSARLEPDAPGTYYAMAGVLAELGRREEALGALGEAQRRARALGRPPADGLREEARVYTHLDPARAASVWREYIVALEGASRPSATIVARLVEAYAALRELPQGPRESGAAGRQ